MSEAAFPRYEVKGEIGRGPRSVVYRARDLRLGRDVVIKEFLRGTQADDGRISRLFEDVRSAAQLNHPNLTRIYDIGESGPHPFVAMEYIEGEGLEHLIRNRLFVPFGRKLEIVAQICQGLAHAHDHGIAHGGLRPGRIKFDVNGFVKILGFGSASSARSGSDAAGDRPFERADDFDFASDIEAVGTILQEFLTAVPSFRESSDGGSRDPVSIFSGATPVLNRILEKAVTRNPEDRYGNARQFASVLLEFKERVPAEGEVLKSTVARQLAELEKSWEEAFPIGKVPGFFDAPLFRVEPPQGDPDDYGNLLYLNALLDERHRLVAERRDKALEVHRLLSLGREQIASFDFEGCSKTVDQVLQLHPTNPLALELRRSHEAQSRRLQERTLKLSAGLAACRRAFVEGEDHDCQAILSRMLDLEPDHPEAFDLRGRLESRQQKALEGLLAEAGPTRS